MIESNVLKGFDGLRLSRAFRPGGGVVDWLSRHSQTCKSQ